MTTTVHRAVTVGDESEGRVMVNFQYLPLPQIPSHELSKKQSVELGTGADESTVPAGTPGVVFATVHSAHGVKQADRDGQSDPYVVVDKVPTSLPQSASPPTERPVRPIRQGNQRRTPRTMVAWSAWSMT